MIRGFVRRFVWALRRLTLPVPRNALVLEVGGGHNPYPKADIVVDRYIESHHRQGAISRERPLILATGENLPFCDKVFDFVIASHVLEHSLDPKAFLLELQRVGKAGYIEVPNPLQEILTPSPIHSLEVALHNNTLLIRKKENPDSPEYSWITTIFSDSWYNHKGYKKFRKDFPDAFAIRYYWNDKIEFEVLNDEIDVSWIKNVKRTTIDSGPWPVWFSKLARKMYKPKTIALKK